MSETSLPSVLCIQFSLLPEQVVVQATCLVRGLYYASAQCRLDLIIVIRIAHSHSSGVVQST